MRRFARRRLVVERRTDAAGHRRADNRSPPFSASLAHEDDVELTHKRNWRNPAAQSPRLSTASACHQRHKRATRLTVPCSKLSCVVPLAKVGAKALTEGVAALAGRRARPPRQGPPAPRDSRTRRTRSSVGSSAAGEVTRRSTVSVSVARSRRAWGPTAGTGCTGASATERLAQCVRGRNARGPFGHSALGAINARTTVFEAV